MNQECTQDPRTKETQYQGQIEMYLEDGLAQMGLTTSHTWRTDPKRLLFLLARYKFVSRMLVGCKNVLEVGCGDGFGSRLISQTGAKVICADFDPVFIEEAKKREGTEFQREFIVANFLENGIANRTFDAAYLLDVIEHIHPTKEGVFLTNICKTLTPDGICIIGAPSLESQTYASEPSKKGHVNCKSGEATRSTLKNYFKNVFMFSMNDETVHTGFLPMAHYHLALCAGVK